MASTFHLGRIFDFTKRATAAPVQRVVRLRLRFRTFTVSVCESFNNFETSVQHVFAVFKIECNQFLIVTAQCRASAMQSFRARWYFERRRRVLFEDRKIQNLKWFEPIEDLTHPCAPKRQADLIRDDCSGVCHQLHDEAPMALFIHEIRIIRTLRFSGSPTQLRIKATKWRESAPSAFSVAGVIFTRSCSQPELCRYPVFGTIGRSWDSRARCPV